MSINVYTVGSPRFIAKALSSTVGVTLAEKVRNLVETSIRIGFDLLFLTSLLLGGGCFSLVFSIAIAAAACWAFLIEGPEAMYSSVSPNFRQTVNKSWI